MSDGHPTTTSAFLSYVHADDEMSGGLTAEIARQLSDQYHALTAEPLSLAIDRDLKPGDEWERWIDEAIARATFFIAIITPRYFRSRQCRRSC